MDTIHDGAPPWGPLLSRLAEQHPVVGRDRDWLCLGWTIAGRPQTVQLKGLVVRERARLLLTADICPGDAVSPARALELGARLIVGGMVMQSGVLGIRHIFDLDRIAAPEPDATIISLRDDAVVAAQLLYETRVYFPCGLD